MKALPPSPSTGMIRATRSQKWIDQSQSVNLFLAAPDMKTLSHMYRRAWDKGLKTTYYLRTLQASNIEKATIDAAEGAARSHGSYHQEDRHGCEKMACSIDAMMNGGTCEACQ
jgi:ribonucleoside-diphosphate reductase alpha chain